MEQETSASALPCHPLLSPSFTPGPYYTFLFAIKLPSATTQAGVDQWAQCLSHANSNQVAFCSTIVQMYPPLAALYTKSRISGMSHCSSARVVVTITLPLSHELSDVRPAFEAVLLQQTCLNSHQRVVLGMQCPICALQILLRPSFCLYSVASDPSSSSSASLTTMWKQLRSASTGPRTCKSTSTEITFPMITDITSLCHKRHNCVLFSKHSRRPTLLASALFLAGLDGAVTPMNSKASPQTQPISLPQSG